MNTIFVALFLLIGNISYGSSMNDSLGTQTVNTDHNIKSDCLSPMTKMTGYQFSDFIPNTLYVTSINPIKINAVLKIMSVLFPNKRIEVIGVPTKSNINEQPVNDETETGAMNRIKNAEQSILQSGSTLDSAAIISIENGIFFDETESIWEDKAVVIIKLPDGRILKTISRGVIIPGEIVESARMKQGGFTTNTIGSTIAELHPGTDKQNPHKFLTNGAFSREIQIQNALKQVISNGSSVLTTPSVASLGIPLDESQFEGMSDQVKSFMRSAIPVFIKVGNEVFIKTPQGRKQLILDSWRKTERDGGWETHTVYAQEIPVRLGDRTFALSMDDKLYELTIDGFDIKASVCKLGSRFVPADLDYYEASSGHYQDIVAGSYPIQINDKLYVISDIGSVYDLSKRDGRPSLVGDQDLSLMRSCLRQTDPASPIAVFVKKLLKSAEVQFKNHSGRIFMLTPDGEERFVLDSWIKTDFDGEREKYTVYAREIPVRLGDRTFVMGTDGKLYELSIKGYEVSATLYKLGSQYVESDRDYFEAPSGYSKDVYGTDIPIILDGILYVKGSDSQIYNISHHSGYKLLNNRELAVFADRLTAVAA